MNLQYVTKDEAVAFPPTVERHSHIHCIIHVSQYLHFTSQSRTPILIVGPSGVPAYFSQTLSPYHPLHLDVALEHRATAKVSGVDQTYIKICFLSLASNSHP